ncbi:MAG: zinc ribbon domain-containing protein [Promethearchaeia archaeon]
MINNKQQKGTKSFGDILSDGFQLFISNYVKIIIPFLIFLVTSSILKVILLYDLSAQVTQLTNEMVDVYEGLLGSNELQFTEAQYDKMTSYLLLSSALTFFNSLILLLFLISAMASVSNYLVKKYNGEETDFWTEFKNTFRNRRLIYVILLFAIGMSIGAVLFYIPNVVIYLYFIFYLFTFHGDQGRQINKAKSLSKVSGAKTRLIGLFLIVVIIDYVANFSISFLSDLFPASGSLGMVIFLNVLMDLPSILLGPLLISLLTPLYSNLKIKKEIQSQSRWQSPQQERYEQPTPYESPYRDQSKGTQTQPQEPKKTIQEQDQTKKGYYCPFCGYYVRVPKKYCPNCGESLDPLNE